jgi:hypothetical protein
MSGILIRSATGFKIGNNNEPGISAFVKGSQQ